MEVVVVVVAPAYPADPKSYLVVTSPAPAPNSIPVASVVAAPNSIPVASVVAAPNSIPVASVVAPNSIPVVTSPAPAANSIPVVSVVAPNSIPEAPASKLMVFPTVAPKSKVSPVVILNSAPDPRLYSALAVVVVSKAPCPTIVGLSGLVE